MKHSKSYERRLEHGMILNVTISVDVKNCNEKDHTKMFSEFAQCSRAFYLNELKSVGTCRTETTQGSTELKAEDLKEHLREAMNDTFQELQDKFSN